MQDILSDAANKIKHFQEELVTKQGQVNAEAQVQQATIWFSMHENQVGPLQYPIHFYSSTQGRIQMKTKLLILKPLRTRHRVLSNLVTPTQEYKSGNRPLNLSRYC